jgi:N-terminal domain of anti-restriction factor ArdC
MKTTTSITPISENPKQPQPRQTAKEVIAANVKSLIEQLEAGHSDALTAYLNAMSRFYNYSFGNVLEIARQRPDATRVAGMYAWNQLGRKVKKGERGIRILAPIVGVKRKKDEEAEKDITKQNTRVLVGFRNAYVFDRLSRDLRPARPVTVSRTARRQACSSMAAATSSPNWLALCKAV